MRYLCIELRQVILFFLYEDDNLVKTSGFKSIISSNLLAEPLGFFSPCSQAITVLGFTPKINASLGWLILSCSFRN